MPLRTTVIAISAALLVSACVPADTANTVVIAGSDTEVQLVSALVEAFSADHADAHISVAGGGSAVGIAALINGETDITNSSRQMKPEEIASARDKGMDPREFILARDGLSVIVHASNPVRTLTMGQLADIYSGTITHWKDVGGKDEPIVLYGRQSTSGTFGFFRDTVVKTDYASSMRQMEGTEAIVDGVTADTQGIGYAGVGYVLGDDGAARSDINVLTIAPAEGSDAVSPLDMAAVMSGKYPIFRRIYQYLPALPAKDSLVAQLLEFETSERGMELVQEQGFYPLTAEDLAHNRDLLGMLR
jgi:phosphate transport system substrate-binding protein